MPRCLRQLEERDGDRSCVSLTRYVETIRGEDRCFRHRIRRGPNANGHQVAFESRKLEDVERCYLVHEKELLAVVHCLRLWHAGRNYCRSFVLEYRTGSNNHVADVLSYRVNLATFGSVVVLSSSTVATSIRDQARELLPKDPTAQGLVHLVEQGHSGDERTYALVQRAYYWLLDDVETYVHTCLIRQQDKADHKKKTGLLQPLLIPKRPWESVSMDYISGLHKAGDLGTIHLFFKHVDKYWDLQKDIYSEGLGEALDVAQFVFQCQNSSSTNKSAFEIITGQQPLLPHTLDSPQGVRSPLTRSFSQEWKQNVDIARSFLEKAQKRMKKYADHNCRFVEFIGGDLVMVKVLDSRLSKSSRGRYPWLMQNIFHVRQLKKNLANKEDDACNQPRRPQHEFIKTKEKKFTMLIMRQGRHHLRLGRMSRAARTLGTLDAHLATQPLNPADQQHSPKNAGLPQS
ncbi:UNVERIFIED_CONTAM: Transposon Tf2-11 polyprotein [Sesamum calycinum]|uniref:Transposon Tf2-11 polyprotein n=1 Tax=Sesamum calycinum TaxID=2727403 RepID=A0AAW2SUD7_9LAMI